MRSKKQTRFSWSAAVFILPASYFSLFTKPDNKKEKRKTGLQNNNNRYGRIEDVWDSPKLLSDTISDQLITMHVWIPLLRICSITTIRY
jgi:hypothetical protein